MIRIYKDKDVKVVTRGAYEQFYKPQGYNIIIENVEIHTEKNKDNDIENKVTKPKRSSSNTKKNKNAVIEY